MQFKQSFTKVDITRAGRLWEWSQGELWLYFNSRVKMSTCKEKFYADTIEYFCCGLHSVYSTVQIKLTVHCKFWFSVPTQIENWEQAIKDQVEDRVSWDWKQKIHPWQEIILSCPWLKPRSQGSLPPVPTERERERHPGWIWSHVSRTKLILRKESFVSQFCAWLVFTIHAMIARAR